MASISKRGKRWLAQVRRKGFPATSKTFASKSDASAWAKLEEARIERAEAPSPLQALKAITLGDIIERYLSEVTPTKRGAAQEIPRLKKMQRDPIAEVSLASLTPQHLAHYRDRRLCKVKPGTIRRELSYIHHALDIATKEWGFRLPNNPVKDVRLPPLHNARKRRLQPGELPKLEAAIATCRNQHIGPVVRFALETAMRRGEILSLLWDDIDLQRRIAFVRTSKTGASRSVPLTNGAAAVLDGLDRASSRVFDLTANAFKLSWQRVLDRAKLPDFRFHDLRHEAISRFLGLGLSLPEVALISGHRDPRMLFRYTHLQHHELADKLRSLTT